MLEITSLTASAGQTTILDAFSLTLRPGEWAALMGQNGAGKSTLAQVIAGHPDYSVSRGDIRWEGESLLGKLPEERAASGVFLAFQQPPAIAGVSISRFLHLSLNSQRTSRGEALLAYAPFLRLLREKLQAVGLPSAFAGRGVNEDFSGGERKRLEAVQLLVLQPRLVILDEIDSGLDMDAIKTVAAAVRQLDRERTTVLAITHYPRILEHLKPDSVHIMHNGRLARSGGPELAFELERDGYASLAVKK